MMKPYVIKQGDYLTKLAHRLGFVADEVWNDPKNAELKKLRKDGDILQPGDILFIPDEPKKRNPYDKETTNRYVARVPKVPVRLVLTQDSEPLADERYRVEGIGDDEERTTDGDGAATFEVDVNVREVTIVLLDRDTRCRMMIGDLDPVETPSGARMRLTNLGYYGPTLEGEDQYEAHNDAQLRAALRAFQSEQGLEPDGDLSEETCQALKDAHGS